MIRTLLPAAAAIVLCAACSAPSEESAAPAMTPTEACTQTVIAALEQAFVPRGDVDGVFLQLMNDYGTNSPEYGAFMAGSGNRDFQNLRTTEGMRAGLDAVRPTVENACEVGS